MPGGDAQSERWDLAQSLFQQFNRQNRLFMAMAVYGSVAHGQARQHSDLELVMLTADTGNEAKEERFIVGDVAVECDGVPKSRVIRAASEISVEWGVEADQYRHHRVIWDPEELFHQVHIAAHHLLDADFQRAQQQNWWIIHELLNQ